MKKKLKNLRQINYIYHTFLKRDVNSKKILFESFHGKSLSGDPYAMLLECLNNKELKHFKFIVVINEKENIVNPIIRKDRRVKFVKMKTKSYLYNLATAKYLVNSVTFPPYFIKREEQVYINTWHGTPFKTLGKDMNNVYGTEANIISNFLKSDFMIHASNYTQRKIELSHNLLQWEGTSLLSAPRFDLYKENDYIENYLINELNITFEKEIILFSPTWSGNLKSINKDYSTVIKDYHKLKIDNPDKDVLLKVHSLVYSRMSEEERAFVIDDKYDIIELMFYTDILITDYSSSFFDFMITGKPIIHYMPNYYEYKYDRGLYLQVHDLPGDVAFSYKQLNALLNNSPKANYSNSYARFINPNIGTEELVKRVINCDKSSVESDEKKKVLIYGGGFANNGITSSLINLSKNFDYNKFELFIVEKHNVNGDTKNNLMELDPRANILYRRGNLVTGTRQSKAYKEFLETGIILEKDEQKIKKMFEQEHKRIFGDMTFDVYIDFSGYVNFWTAFMAFSNQKPKYIYQHNDMYSEFYKVVNGERVHLEKLTAVFGLYKYFNKVIAVSEEIMELNYLNLQEFYEQEQIAYMPNFLNPDDIYEKIVAIDDLEINAIRKIRNKYNVDIIKKKYQSTRKLFENVGLDSAIIANETITKPIYCGYFGRVSPEKGQLNLINMLPEIVKHIPNIVIVIVGDGQELKACKRRVEELKISKHVVFTGYINNPYPIMEMMDYVLLLSSSEGQPMVLLEAITLGKKVIATDIEGNRSVLKNGYGKLIEFEFEELVEALTGNEYYSYFDARNYNHNLVDMYCALIENGNVGVDLSYEE